MKKKILLISFVWITIMLALSSVAYAADSCTDSVHQCDSSALWSGNGHLGHHGVGVKHSTSVNKGKCSSSKLKKKTGTWCYTCEDTANSNSSIGYHANNYCTACKCRIGETKHNTDLACKKCGAANKRCRADDHTVDHSCNTHTHSYSAATCTTAPTCSCGATSGSALGHSWSTTWSTDGSNHWKKCTNSGCTATKDKAAHADTNQNGLCNTCSYRLYTIIAVPSGKSLTYNGNAQTGVASGTGYTLSGTTSATNAGSYTATAKLQSGYRWTGAVTGDKTISWSIGKAASTNPTLTSKSKTYDGTALSIGTSGGSGGTKYYRTSTNNSSWTGWSTTVPSRKDAGTTYVQAYVAGDGNHNNTSATGSYTITINKKSVAVSWGGTTFTYNGGAQAPTASAASGVSGQTLNVTRTTAIDAGTYTSTASLSSVTGGSVNNYTLTGTTKQFTINKKSVPVTWGSTTTFTYNGGQQAPSASIATGVSNETINFTQTKGTDAGSYTSTVTPTSVSGGRAKLDNYTVTGTTKAFTINKKSVAVSWGGTTFTYNAQAQAPTASAASGVNGETLNITRTTAVNAGSYTSTATLSSVTGGRAKTTNYTLTNTTKGYTINPAVPSITLSDKHVIYNLKPQTINAPVVKGVTGGTTPSGAITYVYYVNAACTQVTTPANSGAASNGAPPVWAGNSNPGKTTYYVKATIAAAGNYAANTSAAVKLTIECASMSGYVSIGGQNSAGCTLTVDTRGIEPTGTTRTYKYYASNTQSTSGGTLVRDGGSDSTYLVRPADDGKYIYVVVTAVKFNYYTKDFPAVMITSIDNKGPSIGELVVLNAYGDKIIGDETLLEIKDCYDPSGIGGYEWQFKEEGGDWVTVKNESSSESHSELSHQIPKQGAGSYRVIVRDVHGNTMTSNVVTVYLTFDRKPTIRFETSQTGTDEVIISTIVKSITALSKVSVNASDVASSMLTQSKANNEYTTTFDYRAFVNGPYVFEVTDELGNVVRENINISTISKEGAAITYEIRGATAVSNAQIVFKANEAVRIMNPSGYSGITFDMDDFATVVTATLPDDFKFGASRVFKFQNKSFHETEVTVYGPIMTGLEYLRFVSSSVDGMDVTLATAYALASGISSSQVYVGGQVQSYYGMSMSNALRPTSTLATSEDLDVINILGNANKTEVLSGAGDVVDLESVDGINPSSVSGYTNGNATGVREVSSGTLSTYVSGGSLDGATTYDTFRVKLMP